MLAVVNKVEGGYIAQFNRQFKHSAEKVWAALTENDKLSRWFPNLQVEDLRKGGIIKFDMMDGSGTFIDIEILDYKELSVLEYSWGNDRVRFELHPNSEGCLLVLKEFISTINDHTPKDLAGWHVCLDVLNTLLDGHFMDFPRGDWQKWYEKYVVAVEQIEKVSN